MSVPNPPLIGYHNLLRDPTASVSASAGNAAWAVDWRLDRAWQPDSDIATLEATLPSPVTADYVGLCGHNLGGGSLHLRAWDGSAFAPIVTITPAGPTCHMTPFPAVTTDRWQIEVITAGDPAILAVLAVGLALPLDSGLRQGFVPPPFTEQAEVIDTTSQEGLPLGRTVRRTPGRLTLNVTDLDAEWMRTHWLPLRRHARDLPFFLLWNPTQWPDEAALCWAEGEPSPNAYTQAGYMDGTLRCRALTEVLT